MKRLITDESHIVGVPDLLFIIEQCLVLNIEGFYLCSVYVKYLVVLLLWSTFYKASGHLEVIGHSLRSLPQCWMKDS